MMKKQNLILGVIVSFIIMFIGLFLKIMHITFYKTIILIGLTLTIIMIILFLLSIYKTKKES